MNNVIVCIAKNEDNYIDEWLDYHLKLGFSKVFVYQNNWRYSGAVEKYSGNVEFIPFDGEAMQMRAYNDFIDNRRSGIDFAGFIDCDEFLCLKRDTSLDQFFLRYKDMFGVAINWRCFGDNGLQKVENGNYSVLQRFTKCGKELNRHIKTFLNMPKCGRMFHFVNPHFIDVSIKYNIICDLDGRVVHGPWNDGCKTSIAQLNHYTCKTLEEFSAKFTRGKADTPVSHPQYNYVRSDFDKHNENDVEDTMALEFMIKK